MLDIASGASTVETYNGKTLAERLAGRFYTPDALAVDLAKQMLLALPVRAGDPVTVIDPFCGDGRLIEALLTEAAKHDRLSRRTWQIELRDRDASAVKLAAERVSATATLQQVKVKIDASVD